MATASAGSSLLSSVPCGVTLLTRSQLRSWFFASVYFRDSSLSHLVSAMVEMFVRVGRARRIVDWGQVCDDVLRWW